jgi:hypothetical protein
MAGSMRTVVAIVSVALTASRNGSTISNGGDGSGGGNGGSGTTTGKYQALVPVDLSPSSWHGDLLVACLTILSAADNTQSSLVSMENKRRRRRRRHGGGGDGTTGEEEDGDSDEADLAVSLKLEAVAACQALLALERGRGSDSNSNSESQSSDEFMDMDGAWSQLLSVLQLKHAGRGGDGVGKTSFSDGPQDKDAGGGLFEMDSLLHEKEAELLASLQNRNRETRQSPV